MQPICKQCGSAFVITPEDLSFYEKVSPVFAGKKELIPPPTLCPPCRQQRRMMSPNIRNFYRRNCDRCQASMVTAYAPNMPYTVYCQSCWWGDEWNELAYGRSYDFSRPFIDQLKDLQRVVPRLALMNKAPENSEYCNYAGFNKNCYLAVFGSWYNEDCLYGMYFDHSKDSVDCSLLKRGELCYECLFSMNLYACIQCVDCFDCSDCSFSLNLRGCRNCILCSNLRNKEYHIGNEPVTPEEFAAVRKTLRSHAAYASLLERFHALGLAAIHPASYMINCENCTGEYLRNCKNVSYGNDATDTEDSKHVLFVEYAQDLQDCTMTGYDQTQLFYECITAGVGGQRNLFSFQNWSCNDLLYCDTPQSSSDCFGCVCTRRKRYCILNKQYTQEEYESLVPKIIEHMRSTGEYGEFFPASYLPFAYNETLAQEYFPLSKEEVLARGWAWRDQTDDLPKVDRIIPAAQLPDSIDDIPDDILNWAVVCSVTGRPFKLVKQELDFYRRMGLPVPRVHHDERHKRRMTLHNPPKLWDRECAKCKKLIATSYSPETPEIVYCESCYLAAVY